MPEVHPDAVLILEDDAELKPRLVGWAVGWLVGLVGSVGSVGWLVWLVWLVGWLVG